MQYDAKTPSEYIDMLDDDWRKDKLLDIRMFIKQLHPEIQETIEYKMLCFSISGSSVFHLNAQKNFVGLYVGNITKVDPEYKMLSKFDTGKGCIRIKKSNSVENSGLSFFIQQAIQNHLEGIDMTC